MAAAAEQCAVAIEATLTGRPRRSFCLHAQPLSAVAPALTDSHALHYDKLIACGVYSASRQFVLSGLISLKHETLGRSRFRTIYLEPKEILIAAVFVEASKCWETTSNNKCGSVAGCASAIHRYRLVRDMQWRCPVLLQRRGANLRTHVEPTLSCAKAAHASNPTNFPNEAALLDTMLKEQLGLKLESKRGPVRVLIVDRVEHRRDN